MSDNTPPPQVWPTLRARDARALIRFLVDAFGFEETVVYGDGDVVHHAQLSWPPGGGVMLGSVREGQKEDSWPVPPGASAPTWSPLTLTACTPGPPRPGRRSSTGCTRPTTVPATSRPATRRATAGPSAPTMASPANPPDRPPGRHRAPPRPNRGGPRPPPAGRRDWGLLSATVAACALPGPPPGPAIGPRAVHPRASVRPPTSRPAGLPPRVTTWSKSGVFVLNGGHGLDVRPYCPVSECQAW